MTTVKITHCNQYDTARPSSSQSVVNLSDQDDANSEKATRKQSACSIHDILRYITPEEAYIFEQYDNRSNVSSDLSDPFSDFDGAQFYREQNKRRLSKLEADIYLMSSFSKNFLKTQESVRKQMMLGPNMCSEDLLNMIPKEIEDFDDSEIDQAAREIIENIQIVGPNKRSAKPKDTKRDKESRNLIKRTSVANLSAIGTADSDYDSKSQSAIWRMLGAESTRNGFPISPLGYNIYEDKKIGWLKRDDMAWNDKEVTKKKCEDWLKKLDK